MSETIRTLKKRGAKSREINASVKEVMLMIKKNRGETKNKKKVLKSSDKND